MSFTIDDIKDRGFKEHNPSYGRWEYSRYYDEVPEEVQKNYTKTPSNSYEYEDKEYRERTLYRGGKPYFWVYEGLVCSIMSKGKLEITAHYRKDTGIVEYVYCCLGIYNYWEEKYVADDCRNMDFEDILDNLQDKFNRLVADENNNYMRKLDELFTAHKTKNDRLKEIIKTIEESYEYEEGDDDDEGEEDAQ